MPVPIMPIVCVIVKILLVPNWISVDEGLFVCTVSVDAN
jgi:hypothetical protein